MGVLTSIWNAISGVVLAVVVLIVAFIVAGFVKSLVLKLFHKGKIKDFMDKIDGDGDGTSVIVFIGKLVYLFVFLLFVPVIFDLLGMEAMTYPITAVLNTVWGYVPNIVAAVIILVVGSMIAKLVRQLLVPVFDKINVNKLQEKAGIEVSGADKLSSTLAYIVYVLILIPMIIMALDVLDISVISQPAVYMLNTIFAFIPSIFVGLVIIVIGCILAKFIGQIVTRLIASAGLDAKISKLVEKDTQKFNLSKFAGVIVQVAVVIFFVVEGLNVLQLDVLSNIGEVIIGYMPAVLGAVLIFAVCFFASAVVEKALSKNGYKTLAVVAKVAVLTVGAFMILSQLGIAAEIVNTAFKLILAALAIAFAVAFGIGGKDFAANALKKLEDTAAKKDDDTQE